MSVLKQETITKTDLSELLDLLNIVVSSVKIKKIRIHQPSGKVREITGNISLGIFGRYSTFKSSVLDEVVKHGNAVLEHSVTAAGLVGSIDTKRNLSVVPLVWQAKNKVLVIDEFQSNKEEKKYVIDALLSILEDHKYEKSFAVTTKNSINYEDGEQYCRISDGKISIKVNLSMIIVSMKPIEYYLRWPSYRAFMSRLIPIVYEPTEEEIDKLVNGYLDLTIKEYPVEEVVDISVKDYQEIQDFLALNGYKKLQSYPRLLTCLVRVRAVKGYFDEHISRVIADAFKNVEETAQKIDMAREEHKSYYSIEKKEKDRDPRLGGGSPFLPKE
jgi:hypothetical protein